MRSPEDPEERLVRSPEDPEERLVRSPEDPGVGLVRAPDNPQKPNQSKAASPAGLQMKPIKI